MTLTTTHTRDPIRPGRTRSLARRRVRRLLVVVLAVALLLTGAFYGGGGWYFSGAIRDGITVTDSPRPLDLRVVALAPGTVTLEPVDARVDALDLDARYGLQWDGGYGQVHGVLSSSGDEVTRAFVVTEGAAPAVGDTVGLRKEAFDDPALAVGAEVRELTIRSDGRRLPAWFAPGRGDTWAVLTHGYGVSRTELLRLMRTTTQLGLPSLNIAYRRDREMGGGLIRFGQDEWRDLHAAVRYALDNGARRIVLLGCSSGAGISAAFLESSPLADRVSALVFDAPMLDLAATVELGAAREELPVVGTEVPASLVWVALRLAAMRFDIDLDRVDYLDDTSWLRVPTLVFHGTADGRVPMSVTEELAAAQPDLVQPVYVPEAEHVESWNVAPARYDLTVRRFLAPYAR